MTWESALEIMVAQTGHERFRMLCSDTWPDHAGYRRLVIRMAGFTGRTEDGRLRMEEKNLSSALSPPSSALPTTIPLAESLPLLRLVNSCLYRSRDAACGCSGFRCALRVVDPVVNHLECLECVRRHDNS